MSIGLKFHLVGLVGSLVIRALDSTLRYTHHVHPQTQKILDRGGNVIFTFWHCQMFIPCYTHRDRKLCVLVSRHSDGEYIHQVISRLGFESCRGSTTRGGATGVMEMIDKAAAGSILAFTPDGPRGPRHKVQQGVIYVAKKSGVPIVPSTVGARSYWEFNSWDRFVLPKPFTRAAIYEGAPLYVPPDLPQEKFPDWQARVEKLLLDQDEVMAGIMRGRNVEASK